MTSDSFWCGVSLANDISYCAEFVGRWSEGCQCCEDELLTKQNPKRRRTKWLSNVSSAMPCPFRGCRAVQIAAGEWLPRLQKVLSDGQGHLTDSLLKSYGRDLPTFLDDWVKARSKLWGQLRIKLAYFEQIPWKLCSWTALVSTPAMLQAFLKCCRLAVHSNQARWLTQTPLSCVLLLAKWFGNGIYKAQAAGTPKANDFLIQAGRVFMAMVVLAIPL